MDLNETRDLSPLDARPAGLSWALSRQRPVPTARRNLVTAT